MHSLEHSSPEDWQSLHGELKNGLAEEIRMTRELLSNMHQEEVSLMLHDAGSLNQVLQVRSLILEKLSSLRLMRQTITEKIQKIASIKHENPSLEEMLPPNEEISSEILSLSDQLMALTERMNRMHAQNQRLEASGDHPPYPLPQTEAQSRPKKKASVATFHLKK
jgi:uncharacterized protein with von Willebrand factor type A (vWA) domain